MEISILNLLPLMVAILAAILVGAVWYSPWAFGTVWLRASNHAKPAETGGRLSLTPFSLFFVPLNALLTASVLWLMLYQLGVGTVIGSVGVASLLWAGFALTTQIWLAVYAPRPLIVMIIDSGHLLASYMIMGAILGAWNISRDLFLQAF